MKNTYIESLILSYRAGSLVIDTNLLILYLVGSHNPKRISTFKRTNAYSEEDYFALKRLVSYFDSVLTTPNILTEVSNLAAIGDDNFKNQLFPSLHKIIASMTEAYITSIAASSHRSFNTFGLTDAGICELAKRKCLIVTDDFPFYGYLQGVNIDVINFNHIRSESWLFT